MTPWKPSYLATFEAVVACLPSTRPKTSAGVPSFGWQNGSPSVAAISRSRSRLTPVSRGREARSSLKSVPSRVMRLVTFTMRWAVTWSTEPKDFSIQARILSGGARRPVVAETSKMRVARARSLEERSEIKASRSVILRSTVICSRSAVRLTPGRRRGFRGDHTLQVSFDPQFQARYLVGEAYGFGPLLAVEVGHEERRPESIAGARDVRDLYLGQGADALYITYFRVGYYPARPREDDGLCAKVVELSQHGLLQCFLIHVDVEEAARVLEGGFDDRHVGHYLGEDFPGLDLVRPDARIVVGVEGDDLAEAATEPHGPPDGEALGVSGEGEGRGVHDAGAGDDLLVHLAYGEVGVGAPVDLEVRDAYGAGNEGIGRRRLVRAAHGLGVDAMML